MMRLQAGIKNPHQKSQGNQGTLSHRRGQRPQSLSRETSLAKAEIALGNGGKDKGWVEPGGLHREARDDDLLDYENGGHEGSCLGHHRDVDSDSPEKSDSPVAGEVKQEAARKKQGSRGSNGEE